MEVENFFLPPTEKITKQLLQKYQNFDPVIRQFKSWHKFKTKPTKADTTIIGKKHSSDTLENTKIQLLMKPQTFWNIRRPILKYHVSPSA